MAQRQQGGPSRVPRQTIARGKGPDRSDKRGSYWGSQIQAPEQSPSTSPSKTGSPLVRKFSKLDLVKDRKSVQQQAAELAFVFEQGLGSEGPDPRGSYRFQGNSGMDTATNVLRRRKASASGGVTRAIDKLWALFPEDQKDAQGRVPAESGIEAMILIIKALYEPHEFDLDNAREIAEKDWAKDVGEGQPATKEQFQASLQEVADMWTVSTEPEEYEQFMQKLYIRVTEDSMDVAPQKVEQEPVPQWKPLEEVKGGTLEVKRKLKYVPVVQRREPRKKRTHHRSTGQQHGTAFKTFGSAFTGRQARSFRWRKEEPIRRRRRRPPPPGIVVAKPSPAPSVTLMVTYEKLKHVQGMQQSFTSSTGSLPGSPKSSAASSPSPRPASALNPVQQQQQRLWHAIQQQQHHQLLLMQHIQEQQRANSARAATMAAQSLVSSLPLKPPSPPSYGQAPPPLGGGPQQQMPPMPLLSLPQNAPRIVLPAIGEEKQDF